MRWIIIVIVAATAVLAAVFLWPSESTAPNQVGELPSAGFPAPGFEDVPEMVVVGANISITDAGFEPKEVKIKKGETVSWINESSRSSWPASALHPTHAVYPEGGGCIGSAFDACRGLETGEEFSFLFNHAGTWKYHDHLAPSRTGTVIVE